MLSLSESAAHRAYGSRRVATLLLARGGESAHGHFPARVPPRRPKRPGPFAPSRIASRPGHPGRPTLEGVSGVACSTSTTIRKLAARFRQIAEALIHRRYIYRLEGDSPYAEKRPTEPGDPGAARPGDTRSCGARRTGTGRGRLPRELPEVRAWLVTVDIGYGRQAAYPLRPRRQDGVINANRCRACRIPTAGLRRPEHFYNTVSRFKRVPLLGPLTFQLYDRFQAIPPFDPDKDLSRPPCSAGAARLIRRQKLGAQPDQGLWARERLPCLSTFLLHGPYGDRSAPGPDLLCGL